MDQKHNPLLVDVVFGNELRYLQQVLHSTF